MGELRGCPFCGKTPALGKVRFGMEKDYRYTMHCDECTYNIGWLETEEKAIEKWNHRAEPSKFEVKHAICNVDKPAGLDDEQFFAVLANISCCQRNYCPNCGAKMDGGAINES